MWFRAEQELRAPGGITGEGKPENLPVSMRWEIATDAIFD